MKASSFTPFLDADRMEDVFRCRLSGFGEGTIEGCTIVHARYRTYLKEKKRHREWLAVAYQLDLLQFDGTPGTQMLLLRARRAGDSIHEYQAALDGPLATPTHGVAVSHLPELDATVWAFPNDPSLPHLARALDPEHARVHLPYDRLPELAGPEGVESVSVGVVHYYPTQRCVARFDARRTSGGGVVSLYGKVFRSGEGKSSYELLSAFQTLREAEDFVVPEALGFDEASHMVWQRAVEVASPPMFSGVGAYATAMDVGRRLGRLHGLRLPVAPRLGTFDQLADLREKLEKVAHALPQQAPVVERIVDRLAADHASLPQSEPAVTHGDFHPRQLGLTAHGPVLFDFDEFVVADPARDLASFVVGLHVEPQTAPSARGLASAFCAGYAQTAPVELARDRLAWQLRLQLATKAYRSYRRHEPGVADTVARLLAIAEDEQVLDRLTAGLAEVV